MPADQHNKQFLRAEVRFFTPPPDLAPCFSAIYRCKLRTPVGRPLSDQLHPEWSNLRFFHGSRQRIWSNKTEEFVESNFIASGPSSRLSTCEAGSTTMWGIGLLPLGWARFVAAPADQFADRVFDGYETPAFARFVPLAEILRYSVSSDEQQFERIMAFFRDLAPRPRGADRIARVHKEMLDPYLVEVADWADRVGLTIRTLERTCSRHFGFPPRLLLRRQRMMRSLGAFMLARGKSWTETIDRHYHDQAHFVHEFRSFMGMSPSEYAAEAHPIMDAFMAHRQLVWGSPVRADSSPHDAGDGATGS